jgi:hypothetical protein
MEPGLPILFVPAHRRYLTHAYLHAHTPSQVSMFMKSYTTPLHNRIFVMSKGRPEISNMPCHSSVACVCLCVFQADDR